MKKTRQLSFVLLVTALCGSAASGPSLFAQLTPAQVVHPPVTATGENGFQPANTPPPVGDQTLLQQQSPAEPMASMDRCSKLVGATVKNSRGQTLGKIADVVVDFNSGRVSYCALKVQHEAKYVAVPLAALRPSANGNHLILNADKENLAQAKGFDGNHWPVIANPAWGAQPTWQTTPQSEPATTNMAPASR